MSRPRKSPAETVPPELENELAFLVRAGYAMPEPGGSYGLTPDGRDWLLWAVWQSLGRPGLPIEAPSEGGSS